MEKTDLKTVSAGSASPTARVLLIDNQPAAGNSMAAYLSESGFSVASLPDSEIHIPVISGFKPDFILVNDSVLPRDDGVGFLSSLSVLFSVPMVLFGLESGEPQKIRKLVVSRVPGAAEPTDTGILETLEKIIRGYPGYRCCPAV